MARIYCDPNVIGGAGDGSSWEDAYDDLQDAIDAATSGDEIWVKEGTFTLTVAYTAKDGVDIYASFNDALTGTNGSVAGRDLENDITYIDGDNSYRGINGADFRLDGFVIQNCSDRGIEAANDDIDVYNCTIKNCDAGDTYWNGGGINVTGTGSLDLNNCIVDNNTAYVGAGIYATVSSISIVDSVIKYNDAGYIGGGLSASSSVIVTITGTEIANNEAKTYGVGLNIDGSSFTATDCHFHHNVLDADQYGNGSAINCNGGTITSCIFNNNHAEQQGTIRDLSTNNLQIINCVFADNTCDSSTGVAVLSSSSGDVDIINTTVWGNTPSLTPFVPSGGISDVLYCCIQGGWTGGTGIVTDNPQFIGSGDHPYNIASNSPCIDAGHGDYAPTLDYLGNARYDDPSTEDTGTGDPDYTDIGAYEYQGSEETVPIILLWSGI